jgi:hypothetical protein
MPNLQGFFIGIYDAILFFLNRRQPSPRLILPPELLKAATGYWVIPFIYPFQNAGN